MVDIILNNIILKVVWIFIILIIIIIYIKNSNDQKYKEESIKNITKIQYIDFENICNLILNNKKFFEYDYNLHYYRGISLPDNNTRIEIMDELSFNLIKVYYKDILILRYIERNVFIYQNNLSEKVANEIRDCIIENERYINRCLDDIDKILRK